MNMACLEMVSRDRNKKENNLKVFVRDGFNSCRDFPVDDSGSNEVDKSKEVFECSSRSSVSVTGESLQVPSWKHNPTSSPSETISNPFYNPVQPEKSSKNDVIMGASSLVQIWEARSQQSSSSLSQSLIDSRTSSGLSLSDISDESSEFLKDEARKNNEISGEEIDWCSQSDVSYVSDSYEKELEGRCFLELATCTPRIRGRQAYEDVCKMILRDRENELEWLVDRYAVSKSPRGCWRLKYMLRIRSLERCIVIQERYRPKLAASYVNRSSQRSSLMNLSDRYKTNTKKVSAGNVNSAGETRSSSRTLSSRVKKVCKMANNTGAKNVLQETMEKGNQKETQDATYKPKITKKPVLSEAACNKNGLKKPEIERKETKEGEGFRKTMDKAIVKESEETNKFSVTIAEKVNLWDSKERISRTKTTEKHKNEGKAARRVTGMETVERSKERREKKEVSSFEEGKSMEIKEYRINPQEVTSVICLDIGKEEENGKKSSEDNEETLKAAKQEASETLCLILKSTRLLDGWDEKEMEDEEYEDYNEESVHYDWIRDISRPESYWEDLRKRRELEVTNKDLGKDDIRNLIKRTVSSFLASDFRENIDKILISRAPKRLEVERNLLEEEEYSDERLVECSERHQEQLEENETEKVDLETVTVSDDFSQHSGKSMIMTWTFEDNEVAATISLNPKDHDS